MKPKATKPSRESRELPRPADRKERPIRLDDLIPREDVKGGRGLFGAREAGASRRKGS